MEVVAVRGIVEPCDDSIAGLSGFGNAGAMTNETANDGSMARARTAKPFIIILVASRVRAAFGFRHLLATLARANDGLV